MRLFLLFLFLFGVVPAIPGIPGRGSARGEEFNLNDPEVELRKSQFCIQCRQVLVVTGLSSQAQIRCPVCATVQQRLSDDLVKVEVLQICPACGQGMDVSSFGVGQQVLCVHCRHVQKVVAAACLFSSATGKGEAFSASGPVEIQVPPLEEVAARRRALTEALSPRPENEKESQGETVELNGVTKAELKVLPGPQPSVLLAPQPVKGDVLEVLNETGEVKVQLPLLSSGTAPSVSEPKTAPLPVSAIKESASAGQEEDAPVPPPAHRVVATVNGLSISADMLELKLSYAIDLQRQAQGSSLSSPDERRAFLKNIPAIRKNVLQDLIDELVILSAATHEGIKVTDEELWRAVDQLALDSRNMALSQESLEQIRNDLMIQKMQSIHGTCLPPTPADVRDYYRVHQHLPEFQSSAMVSLGMLIIYKDRSGRGNQEAAGVIMENARSAVMEEGGFAAAVLRYSEGPFREQGGVPKEANDSFTPVNVLAQSIQEALKQARPEAGVVIGPVELEQCLALIRVVGWKEASALPLRDQYSRIESVLSQQERKKAFARYFAALRAKADIRILE